VGLVLQSALDSGVIAGELRKQVAAIDASLPVASIQTMDQRLTESVAKPRFTAALLAAFALLALVLGIAGIYGVMGCRVRWQFREPPCARRWALNPATLCGTFSNKASRLSRRGSARVWQDRSRPRDGCVARCTKCRQPIRQPLRRSQRR